MPLKNAYIEDKMELNNGKTACLGRARGPGQSRTSCRLERGRRKNLPGPEEPPKTRGRTGSFFCA